MPAGPPTQRNKFSRAGLGVLLICAVTIIFDGYDMISYGAVVPALLDYSQWDLTPSEAGLIGSSALVGMFFGSLIVGTVTDVFGRRKIMIGCISWFSATMALCALAPTPELLALFRFLTGVGLGGVIPTAIALTIEYAPEGKRNLSNALMFAGWSVGGVIAAVAGIPLIPTLGWRAMFWIGVAPLFLIVPLAYKFLPESIEFLMANGRRPEAQKLANRFSVSLETVDTPQESKEPSGSNIRVQSLFSRSYIVPTILFWVSTFAGLLLIYGLNTWLPEIMRQAGYPLGSSLAFLMVLNLGAIIGVIAVSALADRFGPKIVTGLSFLAAAACILILSVRLPGAALYSLVAVAGFGTIGAQILLNAYIATRYPARNRATALGWALGIGRLGAIAGPAIGGLILGSQLGLKWNFYIFAVLALIAAIVVLLVPPAATTPATHDPRPLRRMAGS